MDAPYEIALNIVRPEKLSGRYSVGVDIVWKIVSEYDQEIPQSKTADNPVASRGRAP